MWKRLFFVTSLCIGLTVTAAQATILNDDGLHEQTWFTQTFLDFSEDITDAAAEGKRVAVFIEQRGCPYCREMHEVNLQDERISSFIQENFTVVQLNMWGARDTTDLDGNSMEERDLIRKWRVNFTPTIVFLPTPEEAAEGATEVARMPGYFKPFHFMSMFEFVQSGSYQEAGFQRFLQNKFEKLREQGVSPDVW